VVGTSAENAIHLAALLNADADATNDRLWTANGDTIECLADDGSVTVTLSLLSLS
jgi:hypothetical protein